MNILSLIRVSRRFELNMDLTVPVKDCKGREQILSILLPIFVKCDETLSRRLRPGNLLLTLCSGACAGGVPKSDARSL